MPPIDQSTDFEPEDSITYRTFERAFDTHPEECSSSTVCTVEECSSSTLCATVLEKDTDAHRIANAELNRNETLKIDIIANKDLGEEEKSEQVEVEGEGLGEEKKEIEEHLVESKSDEEKEIERNAEERRKVVAESMMLYTAQLKEEKGKTNSRATSKVEINARTSEVNEEEFKVGKEGEGYSCSPALPVSVSRPVHFLVVYSLSLSYCITRTINHMTYITSFLALLFVPHSSFCILHSLSLPSTIHLISSLCRTPLPPNIHPFLIIMSLL